MHPVCFLLHPSRTTQSEKDRFVRTRKRNDQHLNRTSFRRKLLALACACSVLFSTVATQAGQEELRAFTELSLILGGKKYPAASSTSARASTAPGNSSRTPASSSAAATTSGPATSVMPAPLGGMILSGSTNGLPSGATYANELTFTPSLSQGQPQAQREREREREAPRSPAPDRAPRPAPAPTPQAVPKAASEGSISKSQAHSNPPGGLTQEEWEWRLNYFANANKSEAKQAPMANPAPVAAPAPAPAPAPRAASVRAVAKPAVAQPKTEKELVDEVSNALTGLQGGASPVVCNAPEPVATGQTGSTPKHSDDDLKQYYYPGKRELASLNSQFKLKHNSYFTHEIPSRELLKKYIDSIPSYELDPNGAWQKNCRKGITHAEGGEIPRAGKEFHWRKNRKGQWVDTNGNPGVPTEKYGSLNSSKSAVVGKTSIFGGPLDSGVSLAEGAAFEDKYLRLRGWNWKPKTDEKTGLTHYSIDQEQPAKPDYYCAMRFSIKPHGASWWLKRRIMVYDPVKKTAVVCQPIDRGPSDSLKKVRDPKIGDMSPAARAALGPVKNDCAPRAQPDPNLAANSVPFKQY
jgi:hypothetical protein